MPHIWIYKKPPSHTFPRTRDLMRHTHVQPPPPPFLFCFFKSRALDFHDDTSPLTSRSWGRDPILSEHKPDQSECSTHCEKKKKKKKHPKASAPMTVFDIRSDSFSITTNTMVLCEESVFVSTKHPLQSTEKKPQEKTCKSKSFASLQESDITKDEQNTLQSSLYGFSETSEHAKNDLKRLSQIISLKTKKYVESSLNKDQWG